MGFNVYLPARAMVGNIKFNKAWSLEKVLHDARRCVLLPLISLIYFVENYAKEEHLRGIFRTQLDM